MTFEDLTHRRAAWLLNATPGSLAISCRVRLARNLEHLPFTHRASDVDKQTVVDRMLAGCRSVDPALDFIEASSLTELQREFLVERHLISPALAAGRGPRGVIVDDTEGLSVMVNEEDHVRIQVIMSGYRAREAWRACEHLSRDLGHVVSFAKSSRWGYLTACATNVGTGLRASAFIHLPGLVLTKEIDQVVRGVAQMGFTVRGLYGEGSGPAGNLFQISNQITMGRSEEALVDGLDGVVSELTVCEQNAREAVISKARHAIEDKVWRAYGLLHYARMLTSQELMNLTSALRLGLDLGILKDIRPDALTQTMVDTRPSHLQISAGRILDPPSRDRMRARMVRQRLFGC